MITSIFLSEQNDHTMIITCFLSEPYDQKIIAIAGSIAGAIKTNILGHSKNIKIDLEKKYSVGEAVIDLNKMVIKLNNSDKKINVTEKKILIEMLSNPGKTYSRSQIGNISGISQERSIDVMITRLRQKIEVNPKNPKYLQTIRGSGYVLWIE